MRRYSVTDDHYRGVQKNQSSGISPPLHLGGNALDRNRYSMALIILPDTFMRFFLMHQRVST